MFDLFDSSLSRPPKLSFEDPPDAGCVLYRGHSPFVSSGDNAFVAIMTFHADNRKTGDMVQIWLLAENESPFDARKLGLHQIVCGDCPVVKLCYVNLAHRPRTLYDAYRAGRYPDYDPRLHGHHVAARGVRFGAYGDPVLLPLPMVEQFARLSNRRWTGYTHQWRRAEYQGYRPYFMASVETEADVQLAEDMGWRWYWVTADPNALANARAVVCPNQNMQLPYLVQCNNCWACDGANRDVGSTQRHSIIAHPTGWAHVTTRWNSTFEPETEGAPT